MLKIDFLVFYYMETVGVKWPGLKDENSKLSDTLMGRDLYTTYISQWTHTACSTQGWEWGSAEMCVPHVVHAPHRDEDEDEVGDVRTTCGKCTTHGWGWGWCGRCVYHTTGGTYTTQGWVEVCVPHVVHILNRHEDEDEDEVVDVLTTCASCFAPEGRGWTGLPY